MVSGDPFRGAGLVGGRYRVLRALGDPGGFATTYLALDTRLADMEVALKVLHREHHQSPESLARFEQEARILAGFNHPHLVKLRDYMASDGRLLHVLELVPGRTLDEWLRAHHTAGTEPPPGSLERFFAQVCSGIAYAHARRPEAVVHRDLKPANVMVVELAHTEPTIKVLDFGIARVGVGRHTQGLGPGTDPYSAPEQHALRGAIGPWTDVFALGVTFLEMLLGTPDADDHGGSWWHRVREAGEPSRSLASMASRRAWPGPAVWAVLERALQREPSARHPHAGALREDFLEALREDAEATTVAPKRAAPPGPSGAASVGLVPSWSEVTPALLRSPSEHLGWRGERLPTGVLRGDEPDRYRVLDPTGASLEMVYIPPGWCQLGADDDTLHRLSRRAFLITEGFLVGRFPVTVGAFHRFVEHTGYRTTEEVLGYRHAWRNPGYEPLDLVFTQGPSHPVVCVTWHDAMAWCRWAGLSLLTEAGWEYAARGPEGNPWPWGQEPPSPERLWWSGDGLRRESTAPVGSHPTGRSVWGVEDLCGGVWEWTADVWNPERRETSGPATAAPDPWSEGYATRPRARRGGGWWSVGERMVRAAARAPCGSALAAVDLGFRCALPLP